MVLAIAHVKVAGADRATGDLSTENCRRDVD